MFLFGINVGAVLAEAVAAVTVLKCVVCLIVAAAVSGVAVFGLHI